jgi:hypothetical protein
MYVMRSVLSNILTTAGPTYITVLQCLSGGAIDQAVCHTPPPGALARNTDYIIRGACFACNTRLGAETAYPSKSGYWACRACVEATRTGFTSVDEFDRWERGGAES